MGDDKATITYDPDMFSKTASEIEVADPVGRYTPSYGETSPNDPALFSGSNETRNVRPGDLAIGQLENPAVNGLIPDSGGAEAQHSFNGQARMVPEPDLEHAVPLYDPKSQFNSNTSEFWNGDNSYANTDHPIIADFLKSYGTLTTNFYDAQSAMSDELHVTASNIRKMATVYENTDDETKRDVFGVDLPAPYSPVPDDSADRNPIQ